MNNIQSSKTTVTVTTGKTFTELFSFMLQCTEEHIILHKIRNRSSGLWRRAIGCFSAAGMVI